MHNVKWNLKVWIYMEYMISNILCPIKVLDKKVCVDSSQYLPLYRFLISLFAFVWHWVLGGSPVCFRVPQHFIPADKPTSFRSCICSLFHGFMMYIFDIRYCFLWHSLIQVYKKLWVTSTLFKGTNCFCTALLYRLRSIQTEVVC